MKSFLLCFRVLAILAIVLIGTNSVQGNFALPADAAEIHAAVSSSESVKPVVLKLNSHVAPMEQSAVLIDNILFVPFPVSPGLVASAAGTRRCG